MVSIHNWSLNIGEAPGVVSYCTIMQDPEYGQDGDMYWQYMAGSHGDYTYVTKLGS